ncbi:MAG: cupin domain-containing protein [Planctomycetia bacterium]|nr:cupin domain-containing protein [Planctomycetia bacterium]
MEPLHFVLSPREGETFSAGPFHIVSRVQGDQSRGAFEMYELALGPGTVDYHVHRTMDETLYVLEGEIEFNVAGKKFPRPAGSVAFVPRGVHHGFTNRGPGQARVLVTFTPSRSQNEYFRELEKLFAAPSLDTAGLAALQRRFDQELVESDK